MSRSDSSERTRAAVAARVYWNVVRFLEYRHARSDSDGVRETARSDNEGGISRPSDEGERSEPEFTAISFHNQDTALVCLSRNPQRFRNL